jgi:hypothetical protein
MVLLWKSDRIQVSGSKVKFGAGTIVLYGIQTVVSAGCGSTHGPDAWIFPET